jgi:hypothetical protein
MFLNQIPHSRTDQTTPRRARIRTHSRQKNAIRTIKACVQSPQAMHANRAIKAS